MHIEAKIKKEIERHFPNFQFEEAGIILNMNSLVFNVLKENPSEISNLFKLINSFNEENDEVLNLIEVGFLEILTDSKEWQSLGLAHLKGQILDRFNKLFDFKYWKL